MGFILSDMEMWDCIPSNNNLWFNGPIKEKQSKTTQNLYHKNTCPITVKAEFRDTKKD